MFDPDIALTCANTPQEYYYKHCFCLEEYI